MPVFPVEPAVLRVACVWCCIVLVHDLSRRRRSLAWHGGADQSDLGVGATNPSSSSCSVYFPTKNGYVARRLPADDSAARQFACPLADVSRSADFGGMSQPGAHLSRYSPASTIPAPPVPRLLSPRRNRVYCSQIVLPPIHLFSCTASPDIEKRKKAALRFTATCGFGLEPLVSEK